MNRREVSIITAAVRFIRRRSSVLKRCGHERQSEQFTRWADTIASLVRRTPKGCHGCAYEDSQNGRCVDCARVANRTDNFRRKFV